MSDRAMSAGEFMQGGKRYALFVVGSAAVNTSQLETYLNDSGWVECIPVSDWRVVALQDRRFQTYWIVTCRREVRVSDFGAFLYAASQATGSVVTDMSVVTGERLDETAFNRLARIAAAPIRIAAAAANGLGETVKKVAEVPMWIAIAGGIALIGYVAFKAGK